MTLVRPLRAGLAFALLAGCTIDPVTQAPAESVSVAALPSLTDAEAVAASEDALVRAIEEDGDVTAMRRFASPDAMLFGPDGLISAVGELEGGDNPAPQMQSDRRSILTSCDGSMAMTDGVATWPNGNRGIYLMVWQRAADGTYRWVHDLAFTTGFDPDTIAFKGELRASCTAPVWPAGIAGDSLSGTVMFSDDGTMAWQFIQQDDGSGLSIIWLMGETEMQIVANATVMPG